MPLYHFKAPLNFQATLRYIGRFENDTVHAVRDNAYYHVLSDAHGYFLVEVTAAKEQSLRVTIVKGTTTLAREKLLAHFVERTFGPDDILNAFYNQRGKDEAIKRIIRKFRGVRLVGVVKLWDCMCWSVIGQQVSVRSAFATRSRLTKLCSAEIRWNGEIYQGFPTPQAFLKLSPDEMRAAGLSRQKAGYLTGIAAAFTNGTLNEKTLCTAPAADMRAALLNLKGIGPWSADYAMMRMHRDPDACPFEDIGVRDAVANEYGLNKQATIEQVKTISESWRPFRAYTTFYLWQTLLKQQ